MLLFDEEDIKSAMDLVEMDRDAKKIAELPLLVESDTMKGKMEGRYRTVSVKDLEKGMELNYVLDIKKESFDDPEVNTVLGSARTIFVNAVMGYTPHFTEGSAALDQKIDLNGEALKFYGGGDTLQEFKDLCPGLYLSVLDNSRYFFFTGGGTVLKAIEAGTPYGLEPVRALIENGERQARL